MWDTVGGMRSLETYLQERGVDTSGWAMAEATGISDDGDAILARGTTAGFDNGPILITGLTHPIPAVLHSGFSSDGQKFEVTLDTRAGQDYWVEGSSSPASTVWNMETTPSAGTGSSATLSLPITGYPEAGYYFRVVTDFSPAE